MKLRIHRFLRAVARMFPYTRALESSLDARERQLRELGYGRKPFSGSRSEVAHEIRQLLDRIMPLGADYEVSVTTRRPGTVGIDVVLSEKGPGKP